MYEENTKDIEIEEQEKKTKKTFKFDYRSALKKFAILMIIVFAFIFITTKITQNSEKKIFEKNLNAMKNGAYKYFKENERPTEMNESYTISLQDLIDDDYVSSLKDKYGNDCNPIDSSASLEKMSASKYNLTETLICSGKQMEKSYELSYSTTSNASSNASKAIYYKLQKGVSVDNYQYTCPEGYTLHGKSCYANASVLTAPVISQYKTVSAKETKASYKKDADIYEYVEKIRIVKEGHYTCSNKKATLVEDQCIIQKDSTMKQSTVYSCSSGELQGSRCKITAAPIKEEEKFYCSSGDLQGSKCRITKNYNVKSSCPKDYPNRSGNRCYYTEKATRKWSNKELKIYRKPMKSTNYKKYDLYEEYLDSNGNKQYKYYYSYLTNTYQCDNELAQLHGSKCYFYSDMVENKVCPSGYEYNAEENNCVRYIDAKIKKDFTTCPSGYTKKGSGSNTTCYKYVSAEKSVKEVPKCSFGYELKDNACVKTTKATWVESNYDYVCPTGYESKGSGSHLECYKKTTSEGYYYCKNADTYLKGDKCVRDAKTKFVGYKCPSGYSYNGTLCVKVLAGDKVSPIKTNNPNLIATYKWSDKKSESGWTWTGETKEL